MIPRRSCWPKLSSTGRFTVRWRRKLLSPAKRRKTVGHACNTLVADKGLERRACRMLGQPRSTGHRRLHIPNDEPRLVKVNCLRLPAANRPWSGTHRQARDEPRGNHAVLAHRPLRGSSPPSNHSALDRWSGIFLAASLQASAALRGVVSHEFQHVILEPFCQFIGDARICEDGNVSVPLTPALELSPQRKCEQTRNS